MKPLLMLAKSGLSPATSDKEVVQAALEVWYGKEVDVALFANLTDNEKRTAGYLLDRLSRFNCVEPKRKKMLQALCQSLSGQVAVLNSEHPVDAVAHSWGMNTDLKPFRSALLPYQTRQYQRTHNAA